MRLRLVMKDIPKTGGEGDELVNIEVNFDLDDASEAVEEVGLQIVEQICRDIRGNENVEFPEQMIDAYDLTIQVFGK